ncbi:MAG TPA: PQQ-binding-like beta-propeller repeat protein, partial [Gemmataceae bacterium]
MRRDTWLVAALVLFGTNLPARGEPAPRDPADWPTYNHGATGWRFNAAEKHLGPGNVGGLVEKWRFPPEGAREKIGAVHMTPAVVNGHVYFGTATDPTFYKLTPSGKLKWKYRNTTPEGKTSRSFLGIPSAAAFLGSPLVTADSVYFGDIGGFVYCLDRFTGKERWKLNTRAEPFPGAHGSNCVFSSPVLADGKVIVAGGAWEHDDATKPGYECCRGRGFVIALEPATGKLFWKYDVGPEPERFDPPLKISDDWGEHVFHFGPSTSSVWCTPSYDAATRTLYFGTDVHNSPRRPTKEDPRRYTPHSAAVVALDARTGEERWVTQVNPGDVWNYAMRAYDPKTGLYKDQSIGDTPKIYTIPGDAGPQKVVGCGCKNGGFYVFDAADGKLLAQTPVYKGPPAEASELKLDPRTLA